MTKDELIEALRDVPGEAEIYVEIGGDEVTDLIAVVRREPQPRSQDHNRHAPPGAGSIGIVVDLGGRIEGEGENVSGNTDRG